MEYNIYTKTCDVPKEVNFNIVTKNKNKKTQTTKHPQNLSLLSNE